MPARRPSSAPQSGIAEIPIPSVTLSVANPKSPALAHRRARSSYSHDTTADAVVSHIKRLRTRFPAHRLRRASVAAPGQGDHLGGHLGRPSDARLPDLLKRSAHHLTRLRVRVIA